MKLKLTAFFTLACFYSFGQAGSPKLDFGTNGKVVTPIGSSTDRAQAIAVQSSDGRIVVAGHSYNGSNYDIAVVRYNTDGTLDNSFDGDGKVTTAIGTGNDYAYAVAIQNDGKIVVAGATAGATVDFAIVRYNTDGSLDNTFDGDGKVTIHFGVQDDEAYALAIQGDGKIVVGGYAYNGDWDFGIARLNSDGTLDNTFDGDGRAIVRFGSSHDALYGLSIQPDGKIVGAGHVAFNNFGLIRLHANGSLDTGFDTDGMVVTDIRGTADRAYDVSLQEDGKIVVAGNSSNGSNNDFAIVRYNTDGSPDNTFGSDGKVTTDISGNEEIQAIAIQNDNKILVAGFSGTSADFALARYTSTGALDNTFNSDGIATMSIGPNDLAYAMQLAGLRIYVAGYTNLNGTDDFALTAFENDAYPLPVRLGTFTASRTGNHVQLSWSTLSEVGMSHFDIERSSDGKNFTSIGSVKAEGNTSTVRNYSFTDVQPMTPVNYYRLKIVDNDRKPGYSSIITVRMNRNVKLEVHPNPATTTLNLQFTPQDDRIIIQDVTGRVVKVVTFDSPGTIATAIDISDLHKGLYFLKSGNASVKFVKQ